jgi:outer membrane lipoprotein-sorting protein
MIDKPQQLLMTVLVSYMLLLSGCAQMSAKFEDNEQQVTGGAENLQNNVDSVVIFIYPESGPISSGRYYHLPITESSKQKEL